MHGLLRRRRSPAPFLLTALLIAGLGLAACEDDEDVTGPIGPTDVSGFWSGQYQITGCTLSGASDPSFCSDDFRIQSSLILEMDLEQDGSDVFGVMGQGTLQGDVDGTIDDNAVLVLFGVLGSDTLTTTEILAWQTGLVGDSLVGSWRFRADDHAGLDKGTAVVDANMRLLGPTVLKLFGCPVEGQLDIDDQVSGELEVGDCEFADASFFDLYSFSGSPGDSIEIALRSPAFDAFLIITDEDEGEVASDDDSGGGANGTDAAIVLVFDGAARLVLAANSFAAGESGPYTLSATDLRPSSPVALAPGPAAVSGGFRVISGEGGDAVGRKMPPRRIVRVRGGTR